MKYNGVMNSIARLGQDRNGTAMILFGLMTVPLVGFAGAAVDMARWSNAAKTTKRAADAAVLAGVAALKSGKTNAEAKAVAEKYYADNIAGRLTLKADNMTFSVNSEGTKVTASGDAAIDTTLLKIIGVDSLPIKSSTGSGFAAAELIASGGGGNLEIAVMLDVTGSMCDDGVGPCSSGTKLDALKQAAAELVDLVVWDDQSQNTSRVALVPFSTRVRVGPDGGGGDLMQAMTGLAPTWTGWHQKCVQSTGSWTNGSETTGSGDWQCTQYQAEQVTWKIMPCVTDRHYESGWTYLATDEKPNNDRWMNAHGGNRFPDYVDSSETQTTSGRGESTSDPADQWNYDYNGGCYDSAEGNQLMPLTSDKSALQARISGLEAYGATAGAVGTAMTWYALSPKWKNVWPDASEPAPYGHLNATAPGGGPKLRKVAILMSDGVYNTFRSWKDQDQGQVSGWAKQLCTNMKDEGIEVFTVGFDLDSLSGTERSIAEDTLQSCGSSIDHFYDTLDINQLKQAFKEIAIKISADIALTE